ncbi:MAG: hypothetical protein AUK59_04800 [Candidatus Altarchaeum sp. CG2_30_32_3053]|nr:MAG: hypothetical protein AUK59_04800 [Candidatus Altarchaeum sp. CG2_30_32_3053]
MDNTADNTADKKEGFKLIQKTDKDIEIEVMVVKEIPNLIRKKLIEKKIDAYVYAPHPLLNGPRIHIHSSNPVDDLISAGRDVEADLNEFKELFDKEFKKVKKEDKEENEKNVLNPKKPEKAAEESKSVGEKSEKEGNTEEKEGNKIKKKGRGRPRKEQTNV